MPWGIVAGAAIGAVGSVVSGSEQASGQEQAAATQQQMFNTINNQEQPFIQGGYKAEDSLQNMLGLSGNTKAAGYGSLTKPFTSADYLANQDPGYQFQLQQGVQGLRNAEAPTSGALSGSALKDLMSFNQNYASTGYQNAFNRFQTQQNNVYGRLSGLAGLGQNAATNVGTAGTSLGTGIGQAQAAAAGSNAAGIQGAASSLANGGTSLAYLLGNNGSSTASPGQFSTDPNSIPLGSGYSGLGVGGGQ